jgi:hypothetical protein
MGSMHTRLEHMDEPLMRQSARRHRGAGGIGHDVAELLTDRGHGGNAEDFLRKWEVDSSISQAGG